VLSVAVWSELCRLVRGYNDAGRVEAAAQVLDIQGVAFNRRIAAIPKQRVDFAARVIGECLATGHPMLDDAVKRFTKATLIKPDPRAQSCRQAQRGSAEREPAVASTMRLRLGRLTVEF
jgi:hypothetical protein